ncbi:MAG: hypothetical protein LBJ20_07350 [Candidatus Methanoplasma sp.]|nr:hypothetical protein [Candidatus Methanoplasma sp.]
MGCNRDSDMVYLGVGAAALRKAYSRLWRSEGYDPAGKTIWTSFCGSCIRNSEAGLRNPYTKR